MTNLFEVSGSDLIPLTRAKLATEEKLENWIARDPRRIGLDVLVIGRQVQTPYGGRIDLLGLDRDGYLTVLELKRDRTPREVIAQILDYASWVRKLTPREINDIAVPYLKNSLAAVFETYFGETLPETLNTSHSLVIIASQFDDASRRIVEYLSDEHGLSINTAFFNAFEHNGGMLLATDWLLDQEQVVENSRAKRDHSWSGWYYVNAGHEPGMRSWEDMRQYSFLAAGGGPKSSGHMKKLNAGDTVFAYQRQYGYIGYGIVTKEAMRAQEFQVNGQHLRDLPLNEPAFFHNEGDDELQEWLVPVEWKKVVPLSEARTFAGIFANPNIVCRLTHPATLEFLKRQFVEPLRANVASAA